VIVGRYTRDREIGRGGMGAVWLGRDEVLGRPVAIKRVGVFPGDGAPDLARAEREAKIAASLNHPHIVGVFDLVTEGEEQWMVMEYVDGATLGELVRRSGRLSADEAAPLVAQAASALAAAHAGGVVHRDVKPSNIMVREDGHVKLTDFGIARGQADAALTRTGLVTGSPAYLAPEVASGSQATPASDVWSLGATLFHALAGHPPYDATGNVLGALYRIVHEPPPRLEDAGRLAPLLEATMTPAPEDRWTMLEVERFLTTGVVAGGPDRTAPRPPPPPSPPPSQPPTQPLHLLPGMALEAGAEPATEVAPTPAPLPPLPPPSSAPAGRTGPQRRALLPAVISALVAVLVVAVVLLAVQGGQDEGDDDVAADPGTSGSSSSPDATTEPTSPSSSSPPTTDTTEVPTQRELRGFLDSYLDLASSDPERGFQLLTGPFQEASTEYEEFWGSVSNPRILSFDADPSALTVSYRYSYQRQGFGRQVDDEALQLVATDDGFLIAGPA
jgi:eukaryotic-like serine/threonine-protein kinase